MQGSAALNLCTVASGGADVYYEFGLHVWDIAAAGLMVEEAGGVLLDPSGKCKLRFQAYEDVEFYEGSCGRGQGYREGLFLEGILRIKK